MPRNYAAGCRGVQTINSRIADQHYRWCGLIQRDPTYANAESHHPPRLLITGENRDFTSARCAPCRRPGAINAFRQGSAANDWNSFCLARACRPAQKNPARIIPAGLTHFCLNMPLSQFVVKKKNEEKNEAKKRSVAADRGIDAPTPGQLAARANDPADISGNDSPSSEDAATVMARISDKNLKLHELALETVRLEAGPPPADGSAGRQKNSLIHDC
jgi:hypothetical protein